MKVYSLEDWNKKKKKKDEEEQPIVSSGLKTYSLNDWMSEKGLSPLEDDIAPVKTTPTMTVSEKEKQKNSYLQKGAFEDGFSLKNLSRAKQATEADIGEDATKGILGLTERVWDGLMTLSPYMAQSQFYQNGGAYNYEAQKIFESGIKESKKGIAEYVAKDVIDEEAIAKKIVTDPFEKRTGIDIEASSVFGRKSDELVQSASDMLVRQGLNLVAPGAGLTLTGLSSFGGEAENAFSNNADYEDAVLSGLISAGAEVGTEKIAGIKFGGKSLTDGVAKRIAKRASNKFLGTLAKWGFNTVGEGAEEVIAGKLTAIGQHLTYQSEKDVDELFSNEDAWESFVAGAILGGMFEGASVVGSNAKGIDYVTEINKDEQKVIDAVHKKLIDERQADGDKLSNHEKDALYKDVERAIERGYIDIETIEEVLGGNSYKAYTDAVNQEDSLRKEYEELGNTKQATLAQQSRFAELDKQIKELDKTSPKTNLKAQMSSEVYDRVKNTRLLESYKNAERRTQKLEVDINSYKNESARKTAENFLATGRNNSNETHDYLDMLTRVAEDRDHVFEFVTSAQLEESRKNGNPYQIDDDVNVEDIEAFISKKQKKIVINMDANKSLNSLVGHELSHSLELAKHYDKMQKALFKYAETKGEYKDRLASVQRRYGEKDVNYELTADLLGDYVMGDVDFINHVVNEDLSTAEVFMREIKYLLKMATTGSREYRQLLNVQRQFERAWREAKTSGEGKTQYSLKAVEAIQPTSDKWHRTHTTEEAKEQFPRLWDVSSEESEVRNPTQIATTTNTYRKMYDILKAEGFNGTILDASSGLGYGTKAGIEEYGFNVEDIEPYPSNEYNPKYTDYSALDKKYDVILSNAVLNVLPQDQRDALVVKMGEMLNAGGRMFINVRGTDVDSLAKTGKNVHLGDMEWIETVKGSYQKGFRKDELVAYLQDALGDGYTVEKTNKFGGVSVIVTKDGNVQYSMADSDGNQLTKEQQNFFKDSKVRDENGSLKPMYHGTPNGNFTVFKEGAYFTENEEYADRYQSPSASSISAGKTATAPKTYKVYLNIKNPFDISDSEARDIYINEYIKGGNAMGINPYLSDAEYNKITSIDWTEGEDLREFLIDNGYDYDGLVLDEGADGGYGEDVSYRGKSYVIFSPEQVKDVDNLNPTSDSDIRFSLKEPVEETKELVAVHNLTAEKLSKSLRLGGLPMPSIAIAKAKDGHNDFGEISLVFAKETIDPEYTKKNKVYSGDAWTPTYPRVEYKANDKVRVNIANKIRNLVPYEIQDALGNIMLDSENVTDSLNRYGGNVVDAFSRNDSMKYAYLRDIGADITLPMKEANLYRYGEASNEAVRYFAGKLVNGLQTVEHYNNMSSRDLMQDKALCEAVTDAQNFDVLRTLEPNSDEYLEYERNPVFRADDVALRDILGFLEASRKLLKNGITQTVDRKAATELINSKVNQSDYEAWLKELFDGIVEKEGIRNNQDLFTRSGNRRSFEALHYEHNLENVIKAMSEKGEKGIGGLGGGNIFGASTTEFTSVDDIKKAKSRLQNLSDEEFDKIKKEFSARFFDLASSLPTHKNSFTATDDAANMLIEAISKYKTRNGIANYIRKESQGWATYSDQVVDDLIELVNDIRNMPTGYFEAKPQRAVGFDEVGVFIIPNNTDVKLKQELLKRGYSIAEYDPDVEGNRSKVLNSFEDYMFRIADDSQYTSASTEAFPIRMKDLAPTSEMEVAPTQEETEIAPPTQIAEDYGPLTETEAITRDDAQIADHYFLDDIAPEPEELYNGEFADHVKPADPFYEKDIWEVGKDRSQKAYMYENPEVKPFFQEEARYMLGELDNSQKGERFYNDQLYYDTNGEAGFFGTQRHTSEDIAYLLDTFKYTYKDIAKGLNAIIEDNGKENNAISKRIEFLLDERLRRGYTDFWFGDKIPPNQDYINLMNEKQITSYSDEAWNQWLRNLTEDDIKQYFSAGQYDEIAPPTDYVPAVSESKPAEVAPLYDAQPRKGVVEGQQSMFDEPAQPERITRKGLHSKIIDSIKNTFASRGYDFDEILKKARNLSTFATVDNTPQRVMEKELGYKEGQILSDLTVNKVAQNETKAIKWLNSYTDRKNGVLSQISKQYHIKPGSKESAAAQMYAEGFYVNDLNEIIKYGDAELAKDFPDLRVQADIKGLVNDPRIRQIYDNTLAMINESRARNAYPEIPRLDNYYLHFRAMDDTFSRLGLPFNPNDIRAKDLPTDLNGVTADLKPGQPYFASAMHRTGKRTSFDLLGGLEKYLSSAKNQIYHIDDIQTLRALRNYVADTFGQAHGLENLDSLSEEEAQEKIKEVYGSHLSTFAKFLNEEANILAGKTALIDRGFEGLFGRRALTFMNTLNRQVGSNMVGFSASSALVNMDALPRALAKTNKSDFVKGFAQFASNKIGSVFGRNDGFAEQSPVMMRRKGADRFYRTPWEKASDAGYAIMGAVDNAVTEIIARTKYNELTKKGLDSQTAHIETDKWVSRLMGDRSLGQMPQIYNSKTMGLITKFQLEVRNNLDSMFYDTIQDAKVSNEHIQNGLAKNARTAAKVTSTLVQLAVGQHIFGKAMESVVGYNPAFDIIGTLLTAFGYDDEEDSEDTALDNIEQGFLALLEDMPYTSTILNGGRIPIASALPIEEFVTGKDEYGNDKSRWETLGEVAPYYLLPGGYGQYKKTKQGLGMFDDDLPIAGSYTDSGNLRFPVEDTPKNRLQAGLFGQYASQNARDYFDQGRSPLNEKQIQELVDLDLPIRDYWGYRDGLKKQETLEDKFDYVAGLDVTADQKNIMINNVVNRKEKVDISNYDEFADYEEFDFYSKNTEKYNFLEENGISYTEYKADEDTKKMYDEDYEWYKKNPEKVTVSKAITSDYMKYREYYRAIGDIDAKDASGKTVSGLKKERVTSYIFGLNGLDEGQKLIFYRTQYDSKEDRAKYDGRIFEYINGRNDLSYSEKVTILKELDFVVNSDGTVTW